MFLRQELNGRSVRIAGTIQAYRIARSGHPDLSASSRHLLVCPSRLMYACVEVAMSVADRLQGYFSTYTGTRLAVLFGSRARGDAHSTSDTDKLDSLVGALGIDSILTQDALEHILAIDISGLPWGLMHER